MLGVGPALLNPQDLERLPKHLKVAQTARTSNLVDPEWGVGAAPC